MFTLKQISQTKSLRHGKKEVLPDEPVLEISTMCGHGMIPFNLIDNLAADISANRISTEDAAVIIAKQCHCGVVNVPRVERILNMMAGK